MSQRSLRYLLLGILAAVVFTTSCTNAQAGDRGSLKPGKSLAQRGKVIDFDDEVVEGLNKRPLDSLSQISERDRRRKSHLYRKRSGFSTETRETIETLRYLQ